DDPGKSAQCRRHVADAVEAAQELVSAWIKEGASRLSLGLVDGHFGTAKTSFLSPLMAKFGTGGMYFPYTGEPIVTADAPDCRVPFIAIHELMHQRGVAREDDANFLAWLATRGAKDKHLIFRYSANLEMLRQCVAALNQIAQQSGGEESPAFEILKRYFQKTGDEKRPWEWRAGTLNEGSKADLAAIRKYFDEHKGKLADTGRKLNNAYLKANQQEQGVKAYNDVVRLVIAARRQKAQGLP
ncbi:MAG: DUF3810 family protein, partial [Planctomycetes bacterium]|nr:DUF3810 family protein [Planctomycetota bacterium]